MARKPIPVPAHYPTLPAGAVVAGDQIIDISDRLGKDGELNWEMPPGKWTVVRIGYTPTGMSTIPRRRRARDLNATN